MKIISIFSYSESFGCAYNAYDIIYNKNPNVTGQNIFPYDGRLYLFPSDNDTIGASDSPEIPRIPNR
jgi:hypothetical protein